MRTAIRKIGNSQGVLIPKFMLVAHRTGRSHDHCQSSGTVPYSPVSFGGKKGLVLPEQMRALDKTRLVKRMGKVDAATLSALLSVLRDTFEE